MPMPVSDLLAHAGLQLEGQAAWGCSSLFDFPGVYIAAMSPTPNNLEVLPEAPISNTALDGWVERAPGLEVDFQLANPAALRGRLQAFWHANETVLYVGQTGKAVSRRLQQFYRHHLGKKAPHAGGQWLKTLDCLPALTIYIARTDVPAVAETRLLQIFAEQVKDRGGQAPATLAAGYPFANLTGPFGRKHHGIQRP